MPQRKTIKTRNYYQRRTSDFCSAEPCSALVHSFRVASLSGRWHSWPYGKAFCEKAHGLLAPHSPPQTAGPAPAALPLRLASSLAAHGSSLAKRLASPAPAARHRQAPEVPKAPAPEVPEVPKVPGAEIWRLGQTSPQPGFLHFMAFEPS